MDSRLVIARVALHDGARARARATTAALALVAGTLGFVGGAHADAAAGEALASTCVACHGDGGNSVNPLWPSLSGQHASYTAKQLANFQSSERDNPIMFGLASGLSEEEMRDLGEYYAGQARTPGVAADRERAALGEKLFRAGNAQTGVAACMGCHGPRGDGIPSAGWPKISGQHVDYTVAQLQAFRAGARANDPNGMMRGVARFLSDEEIAALAEYLAGLY